MSDFPLAAARKRGRGRSLSLLIATFAATLGLLFGVIPNTTPTASAAEPNCQVSKGWAYNSTASYGKTQFWCMQFFVFAGGYKRLEWQSDGNLVAYQYSLVGGNRSATWATNTSGRGATLRFQADGNVVVYNSHGLALWASNSSTNILTYNYSLEFLDQNVARVNFYQYGKFRNERSRFCITNGRC